MNSNIAEQGQVADTGNPVANAFSLQLNTNSRFSGAPACSGSTQPTSCTAWQQFLYTYGNGGSNPGVPSVYIQYWVFGYLPVGSCPSGGWQYAAGQPGEAAGCFKNSATKSVPTLTAAQLAGVQLTGSAAAGGDDQVVYTLGTQTTVVSAPDDVLDLASQWNATQWNVYGDFNGGQADFTKANTTLEPVTSLTDSGGYAEPGCLSQPSFTAESNNLNEISTPNLGGETFPTSATLETNSTTLNPPNGAECATVAGTPVSGASVCDIYQSDNTPCEAAYSMDRALYSTYDGPLYQVKRASDGSTANIGVSDPGGDVNAAGQDSFCAHTACTITEIYDQSPKKNNLTIEGAGGNGAADVGADATALPITIDGGVEAYGLDITPGVGYRDDQTNGTIATGSNPSGTYMVASGTNVNSGCCFDFGNAEVNNDDNGAGHMDAVNLTTYCGGYDAPCAGSGPWVEADMENGQYLGGDGSNPVDTPSGSDFVTAMLANNGQTSFSLEGGNAQSGGLTTYWNQGPLPSGYTPMNQEGAIVLGTGGDNSRTDVGSFFEGVITQGVPSQDAENAVQANVVGAGYGGDSDPASAVVASPAGQAVVHAAGAASSDSGGYSSVYTVNSANGDLQESYLPAIGDSWTTQDLSAKYGTPPVMAGTEPVSIVHCGYTSVYTVDASSGDLQESYLPAIGDAWSTQDLSAKFGTPPTNATPAAVEHSAGSAGASPGCGFTSVYTRDRNGGLQETYLPQAGFPGDAWVTQDLTAKYGAALIQPGTSPVAIVHCGYTSVYTAGTDHDLHEAYLPAIGDAWATQDLSAKYGTPQTVTTPTAVVHDAGAAGASPTCGFTSVYTVDASTSDLQESYLPQAGFPGDPWTTQDLTAKYGTPAVAPGTQPEALVHMNYTSVYTIDAASDDLQETYLPAIGDPWATQDLSAKYGTPITDQSPIVLLHPDASGNGALDWTSVYTVDESNNDLQETYLPNVGFPGDAWVTQNLTAKYGTPQVAVPESATAGWSAVHDGYTSVYTVDSSNGHLQETDLPAMNQPWATQDLTAKYGTPAVKAGTRPVSVVHDGYTSVYTVDANGDLQETYLPGAGFPGDAWVTQDLTAKYGTPASGVTPTAVVHDGWVSVYTIDANGDLQETYLPSAGFPGDAWVTQNLSTEFGAPAAVTSASPVALVHDGYTSVYTIDAGSDDLQETYLPAIGGAWATQDLSVKFGTPSVNYLMSPTAIVHDGWVSVYTVDADSSDLQETYLPAIGDAWATHDLSAKYSTPEVAVNTQPVALFHDGYTSVYTADAANNHLQETYLPSAGFPGDAWVTLDLTTKYGTPAASGTIDALIHPDTTGGLTWTSVYTIDSNGDLQETYLPAIGDAWATQNLSTKYGTPTT